MIEIDALLHVYAEKLRERGGKVWFAEINREDHIAALEAVQNAVRLDLAEEFRELWMVRGDTFMSDTVFAWLTGHAEGRS